MTVFGFDLLSLGGQSLETLPNVRRKGRLRAVLDGAGPRLQFAEHVVGEGETLFAAMCREGYEGIVSKRADAPYRGKRTKTWLKIKCRSEEHTSELQSLMRISYAVFCLKKKKQTTTKQTK